MLFFDVFKTRLETSFRLSRAPRGSRFLRKPAPCGRGGCAAPLAALGVYISFCSRPTQGLCPCTPSGDTSPEPHALWRGITCRKENEKNERYIIYNNARVIFRFFILSTSAHIRFETSFRLSQAPRGSRFLRKPAPCGRGCCAAPLAALEGRKEFGCGLMQGLCPCTPSRDTSPEPPIVGIVR